VKRSPRASSTRRRAAVALFVTVVGFACSSGGEGDGDGSAETGGTSGAGASGTSTGGSSTGGSSTGGATTGGTATGGSSGGGALAYEPCELGARTGAFTVELGDGFTAVTGSVRDAVTPSDVPDLVSEEGSCRLFRSRNLFCDPPCGSGTTCAETMSCVASPTNQSVGTVSVTGLAAALEMTPSGVNSYTNPASPELPHPGFVEGAVIVLSATGGALAAFELEGRGIAPFELDDAPLSVVRGQALALRWTPPGETNGQVVHLKFEFNRHGGTPTWLECDAPDTGSFDVPSTLLDALLDLEVSGWPTLTAARRTVDSTEVGSGCVELRVVSAVTVDVALPGITSCDSENPCPPPQACQANLLCE
jgi:hypothetical protein